MGDARLMIRSCGPLVSFQDRGRFGMMRFGVPASGPMDRLAYAAAHAALGRPQGTAIEISVGGLELACESGEVSCCITGGGFEVRHSGSVAKSWYVRTLRAGDVLSVRPGGWGSWAYLAFSGELVCRQWRGSTSTHSSSGLGGGGLASGMVVVVRDPRVSVALEGELPVPDFARSRALAGVVLGPQTAQFRPETVAALQQASFAVTTACDRMGMRLAGPALHPRDAMSIPSEPVVRGSIQVGGDGVASVLLADHQTTGGYPKIATILSSDIDGVAQLRPHDRLSFRVVNAEEGVRIARSHAQSRTRYLQEVVTTRGSLEDRLMRENLISGVV
jgi:allophanate hydrolase